MLKVLFLLSIITVSTYSAQGQALKSGDQYSILESGRQLKNQVTLNLVLSTQAQSDAALQDEAAYVRKLTSEVDALTYLSEHRWELVSVTTETFNGHTCGNRYYLKMH